MGVKASAASARGLGDPCVVAQIFSHHEFARKLCIGGLVAPLQNAPAIGNLWSSVITETHELGAIKAQPVEPELVEPHHRIFLEIRAHFASAVVGTRTPWRTGIGVFVEEDATRRTTGAPSVILPEIHIRGSKVVEHHIAHHGNSALMRRIHKGLECIRTAVGTFNAEWVRRVVAPTDVTREFIGRHQFQRVDAECLQVVKFGGCRCKRAGKRSTSRHMKRADVHFICHDVGPRRRLEITRLPRVPIRVVDHRITNRARKFPCARIILPLGGGAARDSKLVLRARLDERYIARPPSIALARHRMGCGTPIIEGAAHSNGCCIGCPRSERHAKHPRTIIERYCTDPNARGNLRSRRHRHHGGTEGGSSDRSNRDLQVQAPR